MNNLVYYVYGADQYVHQTLFSIMSALRFKALTDRQWRIVIYTDNLDPYRQLDATLEYLDADTMREWAGPASFGHRRKILALQHSLKKYGPSVLVDSDTYFQKSPRRLFDRIGPGNIIMHLCEGRFDRFSHPDAVALIQSLCSARRFADSHFSYGSIRPKPGSIREGRSLYHAWKRARAMQLEPPSQSHPASHRFESSNRPQSVRLAPARQSSSGRKGELFPVRIGYPRT
jgi:hypothetical protein